MATLRNKRNLVALNKKNCQEHPTSNFAQNSNVPRSQEDYITQVSEEIEGRVTKKLSQEFTRTRSRILAALSRLDEVLLNPLMQGYSVTTPETSRITLGTNQGENEDESQCNSHPEARVSQNQNTLAQMTSATVPIFKIGGFFSLSKSAIWSRSQNWRFCLIIKISYYVPFSKSAVLSHYQNRLFRPIFTIGCFVSHLCTMSRLQAKAVI